MRRRMKEAQNRGRALEVRLEGEVGVYYVILAGLTINLRQTCMNGTCESIGPDDYFQIENQTYHCKTFADYNDAVNAYQEYKAEYIDR